MGIEKFLAAGRGEARPQARPRVPRTRSTPRPAFDRTAHIGVHAQKQDGLNWIGVVLPVGKLTAAQMRGLADDRARSRRRRYPAHRLAEPADLRRADDKIDARRRQRSKRSASPPRRTRSAPALSPAPAIPAASSPPPTPSATPRTSRAGAKRASRSTARSTSISPAAIIPARSTISATSACSPARSQDDEDGDTVEGYHVLVGGGFGPDAALGREIYRDVKAEDAPQTIERMLKAYLAHRASPEETLPRVRAPS